MRKIVTLLLVALLLLHSLAIAFVWLSDYWQQEQTLDRQLSVYRSVDSLVEFQLTLTNTSDKSSWPTVIDNGFFYRNHYYEPVSLEVHDNTLVMACLETKNASIWSSDLLSFLQDYLTNWDQAAQKTGKRAKFLLSDYSLPEQPCFQFAHAQRRQATAFQPLQFALLHPSLWIHSPPPDARF